MERRTLAQYRILEPLGEGGMGIVWLAEDTRLGRKVAIKSLRTANAAGSGAQARLMREARTLARLDHAHIVPLYEIIEDDDELHLIMAYVEGGSLRDRTRPGPGPGGAVVDEVTATQVLDPRQNSVAQVLRWGTQAAEGLAAAHAENVFHRDIKPDNIFLTREGTVRLGDFGIARLDDATQLTAAGGISGTLPYMAPEQLRGEAVDARTDLFALGVTLYELLAGRLPFRGADRSASPRPLHELRSDVSPALSNVIHRLIEIDPSGRPDSARDLLTLLRTLPEPRSNARVERLRQVVPWLAAALVLATAAIGIWRLMPDGGQESRRQPPSELARVAVMPFAYRGGDEFRHLAEGMPQLLGYILDGAGDLSTVDERALRREMKRSEIDIADAQNSRKLARVMDAKHYVVGSVFDAAGTLQIDAYLHDADGTERSHVSKRVTRSGDFTDVLDEMAVELLQNLLDHPLDEIHRLAVTTTRSPEAMKEYLKGSQKFRTWDFEEAAGHYRAALEADSALVLAHVGLASIAAWEESSDQYREHTRAAFEAREELPLVPRRLVEAQFAAISGDPDRAERTYRELLARRPGSLEVLGGLASLLWEHNPFRGRSVREATPLFREIRRRDPISPSGWITVFAETDLDSLEAHLAAIYRHYRGREVPRTEWPVPVQRMLAILRGNDEEQARLGEMSNLRGFGVSNFLLFASRGRFEAKRKFLLEHLQVPQLPVDEAWARLYVAHLELAQGRLSTAREHVGRIPEALSGWGLELWALAMAQPFIPAHSSEISRLREELTNWTASSPPDSSLRGSIPLGRLESELWARPQLRLYLLGLLAAKAGDHQQALHFADEIGNHEYGDWEAWFLEDLALGVQARVRYEQDDFVGALESLERVRPIRYRQDAYNVFFMRAPERWLRARCLEELGRPEEALGWYRNIHEVSEFQDIYVPHARLRQATIQEGLGNAQRAGPLYREVASMIDGCDPEFIPLALLASQGAQRVASR